MVFETCLPSGSCFSPSSVILNLVWLPRPGTHIHFPDVKRYHRSFSVPTMSYLISASLSPPIPSRYTTNIPSPTFQTKETSVVYMHIGRGNKRQNNIFSWRLSSGKMMPTERIIIPWAGCVLRGRDVPTASLTSILLEEETEVQRGQLACLWWQLWSNRGELFQLRSVWTLCLGPLVLFLSLNHSS